MKAAEPEPGLRGPPEVGDSAAELAGGGVPLFLRMKKPPVVPALGESAVGRAFSPEADAEGGPPGDGAPLRKRPPRRSFDVYDLPVEGTRLRGREEREGFRVGFSKGLWVEGERGLRARCRGGDR